MTDVGLIFALIFVIIFSQAHGNTIKVNKLIINPTSVIPQMVVHSVTDIKPGDILSELTNFTTHDVVVERVKLLPRVVPLNTDRSGAVLNDF
jgi:hypothetical protein